MRHRTPSFGITRIPAPEVGSREKSTIYLRRASRPNFETFMEGRVALAERHLNLTYVGEGWTAPTPRDQGFHRLLGALGFELHAAIAPVTNPAFESQAQALCAGAETVADALDASIDQ